VPGPRPPSPVPGRSWTQRGRRRRARCGAGAGIPPGRGPAGGDYDQTPAQFRGPLEQLYAHDFRTITAAALAADQVDLPAGTSPMVLTFDDSTLSQYAERPPPQVFALRRE